MKHDTSTFKLQVSSALISRYLWHQTGSQYIVIGNMIVRTHTLASEINLI